MIIELHDTPSITWLVKQDTCTPCKFWHNSIPNQSAYCERGVKGIVVDLKDFGCTLHRPKEENENAKQYKGTKKI